MFSLAVFLQTISVYHYHLLHRSYVGIIHGCSRAGKLVDFWALKAGVYSTGIRSGRILRKANGEVL